MANVTPAQPLNATLVSSPVVRKVAFRGGNNKYLGWNKGGFLNFCYDDLTSPFVKHELVEENDEKTNGERHVHIKCCFNQKFWRKEGPESSLIVAGGGSADTDNSTWSCSLFRLVFLDEDAKANMTGALQLHLLQQTKPLAICSESESGVSSLFARADELNGILYAVSLDILPQYVAFKGDNGRYLGCATVGLGSTLWLQFNAGNFSNPNVPNEVTASSASTQFRHMTIGRNWKRMSDTYIALDPANGTGQQDHRFMPIQLDDHTVALRSLGNNLLSKRFYNSWGGQHYIRPMTSTIEEFARLTVEEPVVWRRVHSVEYDLNNFEISNQRPVVLQTLSATNNSSSNSGTHNMNFARTVKNSRTWSNSVSYTTGVSGSFTLGIADYLGFGLQVSAEETRTMEWGKAEEEEITLGGIYTVTPEPGQSMTVRLLATEATCSVKFSYVQEDLLVTGNWVSKSRDDGHFTGVTHINLQYDASLN